LNGAVSKLPPLPELTAAAATELPWIRPAVLGAAAIAVIAGAWAVLSDSHIDWSGELDSGLSGARDTLQKTWRALDSNDQSPVAAAPAVPSPSAVPSLPPPSAPAAAPPPPRTASKGTGVITTPSGTVVASTAASAPSALSAATAVPAAPAAAAELSLHVAFASPSYKVGAADPAARIVIQRAGNTQGDLSFIWWTEAASAEPDVDYASLGARTEHLASGEDRMTIYVPIISNPLRRTTTQFRVVLADATSHRGNGGAQNVRATVTIEGTR